ncbi:MAG: hypothetical protein LQ342_007809 [Letrouitia transgressa]|nr:MAG: hypothetical protein LQ342_007809 [Letrouitia transgressa]
MATALGDSLILSDTIEARSRPNISWKSPSIENPPVSALSGAAPLIYYQHALCIRCRRLLRASKLLKAKMQKPGEVELGYNLSELLASAARGCHLCSIFMSHLEGPCWRGNGIVRDVEMIFISLYPATEDSWVSSALDAVRKAGGIILSTIDISGGIWKDIHHTIPYMISVEVNSDLGTGGRSSWSCISATSGPTNANEGRIAGSGLANLYQPSCPKRECISESTGSDDSMELVKWWLDYCLQHHDTCSASSLSQALPTRLIEVSSAGTTKIVRLFSPTYDHSSIRYLALSHCWGRAQMFKLTAKNYDEMHIEIPCYLLSRTFQDAIEITRRLGYNYLWIDSLCIQQDSQEDWEREALRMGEYYGNAVCTIAALGSADGSGGCFKSRNPLRMQECVIHSNNKRSLRIQAALPLRHEFDSTLAPLHKRAWVVQERLLSPRTLYYGSTGVYWECRTANVAEWNPDGITVVPPTRTDLNERPVDTSLKQHYWDLHTAPNTPERKWNFHTVWYRIVGSYTGALLTFPTDKLVAIAGLVAQLQKRFGLSFCAGVWSKYSAIDLIWRVNVLEARKGQHREHPLRRLPNEAPTWSWASSPYPVEHPHMIFWKAAGENLHLTELACVKIRDKKESQGREATEATVKTFTAAGAQCKLTLSIPLLKCAVFSRKINDVISYDLRPFGAGGEVANTSLCGITPDIPGLAEGKEVWCVFVLGQAYYEETARYLWSRTCHGIAVERADDAWRRVGYFHLASDKDLQKVRSQVEGSTDPIHSMRSIVLS